VPRPKIQGKSNPRTGGDTEEKRYKRSIPREGNVGVKRKKRRLARGMRVKKTREKTPALGQRGKGSTTTADRSATGKKRGQLSFERKTKTEATTPGPQPKTGKRISSRGPQETSPKK